MTHDLIDVESQLLRFLHLVHTRHKNNKTLVVGVHCMYSLHGNMPHSTFSI